MANIAVRIAGTAAKFPTRTAVEIAGVSGVSTTTYATLDGQAGRWAAWLASHGVSRGDRVAMLAGNDASWIAAYLGVLRIGAVAVPLDTAYSQAQVRTVLESSGARLVIASPRYLDTARAAATAASEVASLDEALPAATASPIADVSGEDAAVILYTSGTTADPKGVVLTHANLDAERLGIFSVIDVTEHDAVLGVLPLFHALAQIANLLLPLAAGARVVFLETVSSSSLLEALQQRDITILACVPQFFYLIHQRVTQEVAKAGAASRVIFRSLIAINGWLRDRLGWNPGARWFARVHRALGPKMRILVTGGSTFDPVIGRDLYGLGFTLLNAYGLTETSGGATIMRPRDRFTTSVGQPLPGVEIRIAPETTPGVVLDGEILIRGPIVMREYFGRPDATRDALQDGWLHTGDLGRLDADGRLYITGRKKEIIVLSSGKNLYPEEIEAHYRHSEFIKELCVLGLSRPGEPSAERLHAAIIPDEQVLRERGIVNVRELMRFEVEGASVHLPSHKRILSYDIWLEPLPRTTTGKLKRHDIERRVREQAAAAGKAEVRALTASERAWLDDAQHAATMAVIAARGERADVRPDSNLELDLGLDSMERVELLTLLERRQGTRVGPEARATIFTVRHLVDAVMAAPAIGAAENSVAAAEEEPWNALLAGAPDPEIDRNLRDPKWIRGVIFIAIIKVFRVAMRLLLRFRASGQEHLPPSGPFIICPNHQSFLDGFFLSAVLPAHTIRQLFFVGDAALFEPPLMRWLGRSINMVAVDPDANLVAAMKAGAAGLRLKKVLVLFPEGERTIDGDVKKFRKGAAILGAHLNAPVVPVGLDGLYSVWPRERPFNWRGLLPWRVRPVTIVFGPPLVARRGEATEGTAALRTAVTGLVDRIRQAEAPDARR